MYALCASAEDTCRLAVVSYCCDLCWCEGFCLAVVLVNLYVWGGSIDFSTKEVDYDFVCRCYGSWFVGFYGEGVALLKMKSLCERDKLDCGR